MSEREDWEQHVLDRIYAKTGRREDMHGIMNDLLSYTCSMIGLARYLGVSRETLEKFLEREGLVYAHVLVPQSSRYGVWSRKRSERNARQHRSQRFRNGTLKGMSKAHEGLVRQRRARALGE